MAQQSSLYRGISDAQQGAGKAVITGVEKMYDKGGRLITSAKEAYARLKERRKKPPRKRTSVK